MAAFGIRVTGDCHQAAHCLRHRVIADLIGIRTVLTKAGDAGDDQAGVHFQQHLGIQADLLQRTGLEVFNQYIRILQQPQDDFLCLGVAHIQGDAALVAVMGHEIGGLALIERGVAPANVTGAGFFDLDHIGAKVAQDHGAVRAGYHAGQVNDLDAFQCLHNIPPVVMYNIGMR